MKDYEKQLEDRLKSYASGKQYWRGGTRSKAVLDRWSERASANSLHPGETPSEKQSTDAEDKVIVETKKDLNHEGGSFMKKVRRKA